MTLHDIGYWPCNKGRNCNILSMILLNGKLHVNRPNHNFGSKQIYLSNKWRRKNKLVRYLFLSSRSSCDLVWETWEIFW